MKLSLASGVSYIGMGDPTQGSPPFGLVANTSWRRNAASKIVHLSSAHLANDVRIFYKECKSLAAAGYNVMVVGCHTQNDLISGVKVNALRLRRNRLLRMTLSVWNVCYKALRQRADIYHFHDPELIPLGLLLTVMGKRVIYDAHEDLPDTISYKSYLPAFVRRPLRWLTARLENAAARHFAAVVAATPTIADRFCACNRNTVTIRNFPVPAEFLHASRMEWAQRSQTVVYVGCTILRDRGFREIIEAMSLLPVTLDARMVFAGWFANHLREEAARLPGHERVDLVGFLERDKVAALLAHARVGMVVLHPEHNFICSLPIKLFEYMCAGIPVVASDFPLWRQIVEDAGCGLLVDPLKPQSIAGAIQYLLSHPEEARAMGLRGRIAVEKKYNWKTEEQKLLSLYDSLLGVVHDAAQENAVA
jgi:glycosyltransferase involved in cell wall biosynthesis